MRVVTWNMRRATATSAAWKTLADLDPDIALLQEVSSIPSAVQDLFDIKFRKAVSKHGNPQSFGTAVLVKGKIIDELPLSSEYDWVNRELKFFKGNFISCIVQPQNQEPIRVVSVHSPAWPVNKERLKGIDVSPLKLQLNPNVWPTEIIWSALKNTISSNEAWIVGGDYNSSETFDRAYKLEHGITTGIISEGNKENRDRMYALGFKECVREYHGKLVPTYKHTNSQIIHQLDHLFVTDDLYLLMQTCAVGDDATIFGNLLSDHLPIIADFKDLRRIPAHIEKFIKRNKWTFAKTMPEIPHYYVVRDQLSEKDKKIFDEFGAFIKKNGYSAKFYSKRYTYFDIGKFKYWVIGNILNRDKLESKKPPRP